jgi:hypothetical protein
MNMILETPSNIPVDSSVQGVIINAGTKDNLERGQGLKV